MGHRLGLLFADERERARIATRHLHHSTTTRSEGVPRAPLGPVVSKAKTPFGGLGGGCIVSQIWPIL